MRTNLHVQLLSAALIMAIILNFMGPVTFTAGPFEYAIKIVVSGKGETIVHLSPFGQYIANTHIPPLEIHHYVQDINFDALFAETAKTHSWQDYIGELSNPLKQNLVQYSALIVLLAFLVGAGTSLLFQQQLFRRVHLLYLGCLNSLVFLFLLSSIFISYQTDQLVEGKFEGTLQAVPHLSNIARDGFEFVSDLGEQLSAVIKSISTLKEEMTPYTGIDTKNIKILHASDIHNNPAAFRFIEQVVDQSDADLIIDTGDLVDYGTVLEAEHMLNSIKKLELPYVFVPGNHESPAVIDFLKHSDSNVIVLEKDVIEIAGVTIAGIADPASASTQMSATEKELEQYARKLERMVKNRKDIDIIAVHNSKLLRYVKSKNRLLLSGHVHRAYIEKQENYVEINAGTTGASGIRGIQNKKIDFSLFLLQLQPEENNNKMTLQVADYISISHFPLSYRFERHQFQE